MAMMKQHRLVTRVATFQPQYIISNHLTTQQSLFHTTRFTQAQDESVKLAKKNKKKNNQKVSIATRLMKENKLGEALKLYNEVLLLDPDEFIALTNRAIIYHNQSRHEDALADSERAHMVNADQALYHNEKLINVHTTSCLRLAKFEQLFQYANSLSDFGKRYDYTALTAVCARLAIQAAMSGHLYSGQYAAAIKVFDEKALPVVKSCDEPAILWYLKAQALIRLRQYEEALDIANSFIRDSIQYYFPIYVLANGFLKDFKAVDDVLNNWEALTESENDRIFSITYYHTRARVNAFRGRMSALEDFNTALSYAKHEKAIDLLPDILADMAFAESLMGKKDAARKHLDEALQLVPRNTVFTSLSENF
jgi:tetratricopeptide (TPR) repeat protein